MSTIKFTTISPASQQLLISDLRNGDFFLRRKENGGGIGLRVGDHVVFFYGDSPQSFKLSDFPNEIIERRIDSVEIIER